MIHIDPGPIDLPTNLQIMSELNQDLTVFKLSELQFVLALPAEAVGVEALGFQAGMHAIELAGLDACLSFRPTLVELALVFEARDRRAGRTGARSRVHHPRSGQFVGLQTWHRLADDVS